jgi:CheY-like chemotaxis protein
MDGSRGNGNYLLLVEDNADLREALVQVLTLRGYAVEDAEDGVQALYKMKHNETLPSLVITDLQMPDYGNGWLLRQNMLEDTELASIPVVVMSAALPIESKDELHAVAYIEKPASLDLLIETIESYAH